MSLNDFYLRIDTLTVDITVACEQEDYEVSNRLLAQRLTLLKTLAAKVANFDEESSEKKYYYRYLNKLKDADNKQMIKLAEVRKTEIKRNSQQKKKNKAINTYKKFT